MKINIMRIFRLLLLIGMIVLLSTSQSQAAVENLYVEEVEGYTRVDGETLRWDSKREFTINDYEFYNTSNNKYVNITLVDDTQEGTLHEVSKLLHKTNFNPKIKYWDDGSLRHIEWSVNLFRKTNEFGEPFSPLVANLLSNRDLGHRRFDLFLQPTYFTVSLEYFEFHEIDGETKKIKVNTELATDNYEDGRIIKSALHIIKRTPSGEIIFDFNLSIKETNDAYRLFNLIDQPFLWVPAQLGAVFALVYIYIRFSSYWRDNNFRIVRDDHDSVDNTDDEENKDNKEDKSEINDKKDDEEAGRG